MSIVGARYHVYINKNMHTKIIFSGVAVIALVLVVWLIATPSTFIEPPVELQTGTDAEVIDEEPELTISLSDVEMRTIQEKVTARNLAKEFPDMGSEPMVLGAYQGKLVEQRYWCGDVCPQNGMLFLTYVDIDEVQCQRGVGEPVYGIGWGTQYLGCAPIVPYAQRLKQIVNKDAIV